jgi:putative oligomerization/nucleic acid binding protein
VDPAERLARLRALYDRGVLTDAEYEAQRQKIIGAI